MRWTDAQIIGEASRREHHPDNASACWMGGLTVARMSGDAEAQVVSIKPKGKWPLLLAVPDQVLSTKEARRALPAQYSRADAVVNIQNSMLLLAAFTQGRHELLASALEDRIHQPYRAPLCPLLPCLQELTGTPGVLGAALSGAGPSVVVFLDPRASAQKTKKTCRFPYCRQGIPRRAPSHLHHPTRRARLSLPRPAFKLEQLAAQESLHSVVPVVKLTTNRARTCHFPGWNIRDILDLPPELKLTRPVRVYSIRVAAFLEAGQVFSG